MGFVANIRNKNVVFDEKKDKNIGIPELVTRLMDEQYDLEHVTLSNGQKEIKLKKDQKGVSVRFNDYSNEGNPREVFQETMNILKSR